MLAEPVILDADEGVVVGAPPADRLWIRGSGPSRERWPWAKPNGHEDPAIYEVWGVGSALTRSFQIHPTAIITDSEADWLQRCPVPIYTLPDGRVRNPLSVTYPYERVWDTVGKGPFCSSFDHMLSLAIAEGFTDIGLSGVDLMLGTLRERLMEASSIGYWIGVARGRGITVRLGGCHILRYPNVYGRDYQAERTYGQRLGFFAAMAMLNFQFDDGQAKTAPLGWKYKFGLNKVRVSI